MNPYTATADELRAALLTEPGRVLQVCCSPAIVDPENPERMIPARADVVLTSEEIVMAARLAPRAAIGAARHLLPKDLLAEIALKEPDLGMYFCPELFPAEPPAALT